MNRWRARVLALVGVCLGGALVYSGRAGRPRESDPPGLHADARIRRFAPYDIPSASAAALSVLELPALEVVPAGETRTRGEVFRALGLDCRRVQDIRVSPPSHRVVFLRWQVSPSFDLVCMTAVRDWADEPSRDDPDLPVYGVRFVSRADGAHHIW